jgi:ketosteroid isomerase-like protein
MTRERSIPRTDTYRPEHPYEAVLRTEYDARASGDLDSFRRLLADDVSWHVPGDNAIAGDYRGIDEVVAYVQVRQRLSNGTFEVTIEDIVANDRHGFVVASGKANLGGRPRRWRAHGLYRFREGQIAECWVLPEDQREFDRIWAEETAHDRS